MTYLGHGQGRVTLVWGAVKYVILSSTHGRLHQWHKLWQALLGSAVHHSLCITSRGHKLATKPAIPLALQNKPCTPRADMHGDRVMVQSSTCVHRVLAAASGSRTVLSCSLLGANQHVLICCGPERVSTWGLSRYSCTVQGPPGALVLQHGSELEHRGGRDMLSRRMLGP